jgi:epoxide hydrolase
MSSCSGHWKFRFQGVDRCGSSTSFVSRTSTICVGLVSALLSLTMEAEQRSGVVPQRYDYELGGYAAVQSTRLQVIAYGLTNSPGFQLARFTDMSKNWTDSDNVPEDAVDRDALPTKVMLYCLAGTADPSVRN